MPSTRRKRRFLLCVRNTGCDDLELRKVYERLPDMQQWGIEANADKVAAVGAAALGGAVAAQLGGSLLKRMVKGKRGDETPSADDDKKGTQS